MLPESALGGAVGVRLDDLARPRVRAGAASYLHAVRDAVWKQWPLRDSPAGVTSSWAYVETHSELTAQEAHIARLAVDGLTNLEIGAELYLSARTVEWYLRNAYDELGVTPELRRALAIGQADPAGRAPGDPDAGRPGRVGVLLSYVAAARALLDRPGSWPGVMTGLELRGQGHRVQAGGGAPDGVLVEEKRNRVGEGHVWPVGRVGRGWHDVAEPELVNDGERDRFGAGQQAPQRVRVPAERVCAAFAVRRAVTQAVLVLPGPVGLDRPAVQVTDPEFVEARFDQDGHLSAAQGDVDGLLGA